MQLRDKHGSTRAPWSRRRARCINVLAPVGVPLLINDRVDVALAAEADGVHIGQDDMAPADARLLLGRTAIIGLSINTVQRGARPHRSICIDYVGIGGVYATTSKDERIDADRHRGPARDRRRRCARASRHFRSAASPASTPAMPREVIEAGADGVAVISALSLRGRSGAGRARTCAPWSTRRWQRRGRRMTAIAVTIAGSDSSGGAGIQADLKTFAALGVYGASVITALTAQNTQGVTAIHDVPADFIAAQIDAVFSDLDVDAVKIGMLSQRRRDRGGGDGPRPPPREKHRARSGDGRDLRRPAAGAPRPIDALRRELIPRALIVTPNLPEAAALHRRLARAQRSARWKRRRARSCRSARSAVLIKGGHGDGDATASIC